MPVISRKNRVIIPVGVAGSVYANADYLLDLLNAWENNNPGKAIDGNPNYNVTPSSSGRGVTIDSISFVFKTYGEQS